MSSGNDTLMDIFCITRGGWTLMSKDGGHDKESKGMTETEKKIPVLSSTVPGCLRLLAESGLAGMGDKVMTALGDIRSERKHRDCSGLSVRLVCGGSSSEGTKQGELGFVTECKGLCDEWIYLHGMLGYSL